MLVYIFISCKVFLYYIYWDLFFIVLKFVNYKVYYNKVEKWFIESVMLYILFIKMKYIYGSIVRMWNDRRKNCYI